MIDLKKLALEIFREHKHLGALDVEARHGVMWEIQLCDYDPNRTPQDLQEIADQAERDYDSWRSQVRTNEQA